MKHFNHLAGVMLPSWVDKARLMHETCMSDSGIDDWVKNKVIPPGKLRGGKLMWRCTTLQALRAKPEALMGTIYFVKASDFIKIGFTQNLSGRLKSLETATPFETTLLHSMHGTIWLEQSYHEKFRLLRVRGEWFRAEAELLDFIEQLRHEAAQDTGGAR